MTTKITTVENKTTSGKVIKVTLMRGTRDEEIRLDGTYIRTQSHLVNDLVIKLLDGNKVLDSGKTISPMNNNKNHSQYNNAVKAGCVGLIGQRWFVTPETEKIINEMIATVESDNLTTSDMITIKNIEVEKNLIAQKNMEENDKRERELQNSAGYCNKCGTYCYGDCAN